MGGRVPTAMQRAALARAAPTPGLWRPTAAKLSEGQGGGRGEFARVRRRGAPSLQPSGGSRRERHGGRVPSPRSPRKINFPGGGRTATVPSRAPHRGARAAWGPSGRVPERRTGGDASAGWHGILRVRSQRRDACPTARCGKRGVAPRAPRQAQCQRRRCQHVSNDVRAAKVAEPQGVAKRRRQRHAAVGGGAQAGLGCARRRGASKRRNHQLTRGRSRPSCGRPLCDRRGWSGEEAGGGSGSTPKAGGGGGGGKGGGGGGGGWWSRRK